MADSITETDNDNQRRHTHYHRDYPSVGQIILTCVKYENMIWYNRIIWI